MSVNNKYKVFFHGKDVFTVDKNFVIKNEINDEELFELKEEYLKRHILNRLIDMTFDKNKIKDLNEKIKKIDFYIENNFSKQ